MRKHILRITLAFLGFELMRIVGLEVSSFYKGEQVLKWTSDGRILLLRISSLVIMWLYVVSAFALFEKFYQSKKSKAIGLWIVAFLSIIVCRYLFQEVFFLKAFGFKNYFGDVSLLYYFIDNMYYALVYSAFGLVYFFLHNEQRRRIEQHQLELETKKAQLSFLHSQLNPHFLFNSLNNIYSLIYHKSESSLEAVSRLCAILRYMLYETSDSVLLSKEIDYIDKYIGLELLRFDHDIHIKTTIKGDINATTIPPLILVPFVENAFKHGDFTCAATHVCIYLTAKGDEVDFSIENKKRRGNKDRVGGIGLENIRRRLALLYPGKHELNIDEDEQNFKVNLKIFN